MSEPVAIKNISVSVSGDDTDESTAAEALISVHRGAMMSGDTPGPSSPSKTNTRSKGLLSGTFSFSLHISQKHNSVLTDDLILIKLYTFAVYNLKMCIKEDNPSQNYFKEDY